jgi:hypothetical protein
MAYSKPSTPKAIIKKSNTDLAAARCSTTFGGGLSGGGRVVDHLRTAAGIVIRDGSLSSCLRPLNPRMHLLSYQ